MRPIDHARAFMNWVANILPNASVVPLFKHLHTGLDSITNQESESMYTICENSSELIQIGEFIHLTNLKTI